MIEKKTLLDTDFYEYPYQKEKDYIQELFLGGIYKMQGNPLIFKGGTALSKFYGSPRFSDDLDFSATKESKIEDIQKNLDELIKKETDYSVKILRKLIKENKITYELSIRGPFFEVLNKYQHLKIEIDKDALVIEPITTFRRDPKYPDLAPYVAIVMNEREILAEKVVALMFRHNIKARDLYDLYFMIKKGTEIRVSLIDKKMIEYGHMFTEEKFMDRLSGIKKIWNKELDRLLQESERIDYAKATDFIIKNLKESGLL